MTPWDMSTTTLCACLLSLPSNRQVLLPTTPSLPARSTWPSHPTSPPCGPTAAQGWHPRAQAQVQVPARAQSQQPQPAPTL